MKRTFWLPCREGASGGRQEEREQGACDASARPEPEGSPAGTRTEAVSVETEALDRDLRGTGGSPRALPPHPFPRSGVSRLCRAWASSGFRGPWTGGPSWGR